MTGKISERARKLLERPLLAHLATLMKDGSPQVTVLWVDTDGEYVYVNSEQKRLKVRNMRRDPRVVLSIMDPQQPYQGVVQIRGKVVEITIDEGNKHIDKLAKKYRGLDKYPGLGPGDVRMKVKIQPERVSGPGA